jgi:uncharacterized protein YxjI
MTADQPRSSGIHTVRVMSSPRDPPRFDGSDGSARPAPSDPAPSRSGEVMRNRREHRREEREAFGRRGNAVHYQMRQKLVSIGDDYWITNNAGEHVFRVDGKALRLRNTLDLEDAHGTKLCRIQTRVLHIRDSMAIEDADGEQLALVHKALISPLRERWKVDLPGDREWKVQGNIVDHEYEIEDDGTKIAEISKRWFRIRDTYGVEIAPDQNAALVLAVAIAVDTMTHPAK